MYAKSNSENKENLCTFLNLTIDDKTVAIKTYEIFQF